MTAKRIMLCTYSAGYGHHKAAEAVRDAFYMINPATGVYIIDPFMLGRPRLNSLIISSYLQLLKRAPSVYRFVYGRAEASRSDSVFNLWWRMIVNRRFCRVLDSLMSSQRPDVVLCLHPFTAIAMRMWKDSAGSSGPFITGLLTDYTVHPFWWHLDLDGYFVGSPDLVCDMTKNGVPPNRVWPVGIPVDSAAGSFGDRASLKRSLGLDPETPTVLVMGGGLGLGGLDEIVRCLGSMEHELQIMVVTGANPALHQSLARLVAEMVTAVKVFGFVDNVPELMAASDLIVTKPGGVTVAEALATGLPMIICRPIPGQEERNTSFLLKNNLALQVEDLKELVPAVRKVLAGRRRGRPDLSLANRSAARSIADIMTKTFIR